LRRTSNECSVTSEGGQAAEEMWRESVVHYNERERRQTRAEWTGGMRPGRERHRRTLEALISHHEGEAEKLLEDGEAKQKGSKE
jgi:hypothetical protein